MVTKTKNQMTHKRGAINKKKKHFHHTQTKQQIMQHIHTHIKKNDQKHKHP